MSSTLETTAAPPSRRIRAASLAGFLVVHVAALGVFALGFSWKGIALCLGSYYLRMFAVTAGFHRYFSHRTYRLSRVPQFLLAVLGQTAAQKGVLWWASHHRHHHRYSDRPEDIHSPMQGGFWWAHIGWILSPDYEKTDYSRVPDLAKYPELVWLDQHEYLATILYGVALYLGFGPVGLFYGYFLSTVFLWHGTFTINSVMHLFGRRVFATTDDSRNSFLFSLLTMGEGWHNNHHWAPGSAAQGFRWWEIDPSYYLLWLGERLGLVKNLNRPPQRWRAAAREAERNRPRVFLGPPPRRGPDADRALGAAARFGARHRPRRARRARGRPGTRRGAARAAPRGSRGGGSPSRPAARGAPSRNREDARSPRRDPAATRGDGRIPRHAGPPAGLETHVV